MDERARAVTPSRWTAAACTLLAAIWLAMWRLGNGPLDWQIYDALYAGGHPIWVAFARSLSLIGDPTVLVTVGFLVAVWLWRQKNLRLGAAILAETLVGRGLSEIQKYEIARVRPALEPHLVVVRTSSFPSGHATSSMIVGLTLALVLTRGTQWKCPAVIVALILSIAIGLSRIMLGVHWPSDVIGGWSFGLLWVLLTLPYAERLFRSPS
jgi:undecaprenyl-diphosphatase